MARIAESRMEKKTWTALLLLALCFLLNEVAAFQNVTTIRFEEGYVPLFGDRNILRSDDDRTVRLLLDQYTGSGFISSDLYNHGFFSAKIKLPSDYTAGIVAAFYTSNGDIFEKNHDELDFEFLGNVRGKDWKIQTNVYGNGSTNRGREERYRLPFDPTKEAHRYSILWRKDTIIFYIDDTPIRQVRRSAAMGGDFPSKPMSIYATIWDGSSWATSGGKYKVNYKYAPFVSEFSDLVLQGCKVDPIQQIPAAGNCADEEQKLVARDFAALSPEQTASMRNFRARFMIYSFCYDSRRYPSAFPDCEVIASEQERFKESGHLKFSGGGRRHHRRVRRRSSALSAAAGASE